MSNYKLKQLLVCSASSIANWLKGIEPHPNMQEKIAEVFRITVEELNGNEFPPIRDLNKTKKASPGQEEAEKEKNLIGDLTDEEKDFILKIRLLTQEERNRERAYLTSQTSGRDTQPVPEDSKA